MTSLKACTSKPRIERTMRLQSRQDSLTHCSFKWSGEQGKEKPCLKEFSDFWFCTCALCCVTLTFREVKVGFLEASFFPFYFLEHFA